MGQQQLLLVILVTIIVGIATVVAINVFGSSAANANRDAVRQDMLTAIANSEGFYLKPTMMGGGGAAYQNPGPPATVLTLQDLGISGILGVAGEDDDEVAVVRNENGEFELTAVAAQTYTLVGRPNSDPESEIQVVLTRDPLTNRPIPTWTNN